MSIFLENARQGLPFKNELIIDSHAHIGQSYNFMIPWNNAEGMLEVMDSLGIDYACISAHLAIGPDFKRGNQLVLKTVKKYPGRFLGYITINPGYKDEITDELNYYFKQPNIIGIKLHPEMQNYSIQDKRCEPIWEFASEKKLPILSHTWENSSTLEKLSAKYKKVKFIVAHASYLFAHGGEEYIELATGRNNIYFDLASSFVYAGTIKKMVKKLGAEKILFGTDFPFFDAGVQFGNLIWEDISDQYKCKIAGLNFLNMLGKELPGSQ